MFEAPAGCCVEVSLPHDHPDICRSALRSTVRRRRRSSSTIATTGPSRDSTGAPAPSHVEVDRDEPTDGDRRWTPCCLGTGIRSPWRFDGHWPARLHRRKDRRHGRAPRAARSRNSAIPGWFCESFAFRNEAGLFVPVSRLNQLRRDLMRRRWSTQLRQDSGRARRASIVPAPSRAPSRTRSLPQRRRSFRWSIKVDRIGFLDAFEDRDLADVDELIVDIARDHPALLAEQLRSLGGKCRPGAYPPGIAAADAHVGREGSASQNRAAARGGLDANGKRPTCRHGATWAWIRGARPAASISPPTGRSTSSIVWRRGSCCDMGVTPIHAVAGRRPGEHAFAAGGVRRAGGADRPPGHAAVPGRVVRLRQPDRRLSGQGELQFESMEMVSSHGEKVTALDYHCRTIVLNQGPFCLSTRLDDLRRAGAMCLRADFIYRNYDPASFVALASRAIGPSSSRRPRRQLRARAIVICPCAIGGEPKPALGCRG